LTLYIVCEIMYFLINNKENKMSTAKNAQCSQIARNVSKGSYLKQFKFASYGSVIEDSIQAQQAEADRRLAIIQSKRRKATA
jgi:hypothetical protein